jgi:hypothetical protein
MLLIIAREAKKGVVRILQIANALHAWQQLAQKRQALGVDSLSAQR